MCAFDVTRAQQQHHVLAEKRFRLTDTLLNHGSRSTIAFGRRNYPLTSGLCCTILVCFRALLLPGNAYYESSNNVEAHAAHFFRWQSTIITCFVNTTGSHGIIHRIKPTHLLKTLFFGGGGEVWSFSLRWGEAQKKLGRYQGYTETRK